MNNYKFRGKTAAGEWVYGYLMGKDKIAPCELDLTENGFTDKIEFVKPETVGQWTGLKDKNGKEIYEGDYLKDIGLVSFDKGALFAGKVLLYNFSIEELEVIGDPLLKSELSLTNK